VFVISILIIGGAGSFIGPIVGAVFMVILPEALRFLHIPDAIAANMRQIIYGLLLIILMRYRPQGLFGEYGFE
ncbi:MAG: branched-chain amino acid ABC transporter permease, partial [Candidatus Bathyarchaeia archaeon]